MPEHDDMPNHCLHISGAVPHLESMDVEGVSVHAWQVGPHQIVESDLYRDGNSREYL